MHHEDEEEDDDDMNIEEQDADGDKDFHDKRKDMQTVIDPISIEVNLIGKA